MVKKTQDHDNVETCQIDELTQQLATMEGNWKRALADYQNLVKRTREQQQLQAQLATIGLLEKLLPLVDHLEMAAKHLSDSGLTMILKQFEDVLTREGVSKIQADNQPFNPAIMECADQVDGLRDQVIEVLNHGYMIGDRVIRPAKVTVGNGTITDPTKS